MKSETHAQKQKKTQQFYASYVISSQISIEYAIDLSWYKLQVEE